MCATKLESLGVLAEQMIKIERRLIELQSVPEEEQDKSEINCMHLELAMVLRKMRALVK